MKARCYRETHKSYPRYGGRGISVCDKWRNNFIAFLRDMGPRPGPDFQIDRIDNEGHYTPDNCRWTSALTNSRNTSAVRRLTFNGETKAIVYWAELYGLRPHVIKSRLLRGMTAEAAITTPRMAGLGIRLSEEHKRAIRDGHLGKKKNQPLRAVCKNGHPLIEDNIIFERSGGKVVRRCKICRRGYQKLRKKLMRAMVQKALEKAE